MGKKGGALMSKILIVESYPHLASLYREILEEEGHDVLVASDCREAADIAQANDIELVIMDESSPDKCADKLLRTIKTIQPNIKVIVCLLNQFSRKSYRELCDEGFIKSSDYTILQKKVGDLAKDILVGDQKSHQNPYLPTEANQ